MKLWLWALIGLAGVSLFVGVIPVRPGDLLHDREAWELLLISRAPRLLAVLICGAALSVCGFILQMLVRNRFVEPMTVGAGQGAALGLLIVALLMPDAPIWLRMALAVAVSLIASAGFLALARRLPVTEPILVPLVGLSYGGVLGALVTFIAYETDLLQYLSTWMSGEFSGIMQGRYELLWLAAGAAGLSLFAADQFAIAGMGERTSISLGLNYRQVSFLGLLTVSLVSAITVIVVGMIPFVGLVVPNIVSRLYGDNLRATLPVTALAGAVCVLAADILGRVLRAPYEIPVGAVFGVIGAAVFLWLLWKPAHD